MFRNSISILVVLLTLGLAPSETIAAQYYKMACVTGGNMLSKFVRSKNYHLLFVNFKKAKVGASVKDPAPGECAWMDRRISAKEPSKLYVRKKNTRQTIMPILITQRSIRIDWGHIGTELGPHRLIQSLIKATQSKTKFSVMSRNEKTGSAGRSFVIKDGSFRRIRTDHRTAPRTSVPTKKDKSASTSRRSNSNIQQHAQTGRANSANTLQSNSRNSSAESYRAGRAGPGTVKYAKQNRRFSSRIATPQDLARSEQALSKYKRCQGFGPVHQRIEGAIKNIRDSENLITQLKRRKQDKQLAQRIRRNHNQLGREVRQIHRMLSQAKAKQGFSCQYGTNVSLPVGSSDRSRMEELRQKRMEEIDDASIEDAKSNYEAAKEQFKLALRIIQEHMERQSAVVQKITQ